MDKSLFKDFSPSSDIALQRQITNFLRELIRIGKLTPGSKLPPSRALAQELGSNYFTVNAALKSLVNEGLMTRKPRVGTFVTGRVGKLDKVGIYFGKKSFCNNEDAFYVAVLHALQEELSRHGALNMTFWDDRDYSEQSELMPTLKNALSDGKINCLIAPLVNQNIVEALKKLQIPRVALTAADVEFALHIDEKNELEQIMMRFRELNVRKIGLLTNIVGLENMDGTPNFVKRFKMAADNAGLVYAEEWLITPQQQCKNLAQYGYETFKSFWQLKERPEALLITPDTVAVGCVNAILELNVKIPEQLKIIMHHNAEVDMFIPFPVDLVVNSAKDIAIMLMEKLETEMLNGQKYRKQPRLRIVKNSAA